jgi:diguanylate cyclase (GGDEF)-like protein
MDSNVGLAIQCVGILLVTLLSLFMRRSLHSQALNYWIAAWSSLSLALLNLFIGFRVTTYQTVFYSLYFLGEYMFGLLFIAGCRHYVSRRGIERKDFLLLVPAFILAVCLPYLSKDFNDLFMVHTTMIAGFFATSFIVLWRGTRGAAPNPGVQVMFASLVYLTIDYLHYVPVFGARKGALGFTVPADYLQYTSIFDLVFEILLCFGTVMVLMEGVRQEVERVNRRLLKARDRLQVLAQMDPLTEALNRHAFHSLLSGSEDGNETTSSGCVALLDIDNLKPINDTLGHAAGDKAIRAVARAMRSLIRADDMLFRWGGDEFLVLMFKLPEEEANRRIRSLNEILERHCREWTGLPITVSVSYGVAGFELLRDVSDAIERADYEMYSERQRLRSQTYVRPVLV